MKTKIQVAVAVLVMIGVAYWALTSVSTLRYSGSSIMFPIGSGHVVIRNLGEAPIPIEMRSESRAGTFRVASAELGLAEAAKRQGTTPEAVALELLETAVLAQKPFEQIVEPIARSFDESGMSEEELDDLVKQTQTAIREERRRNK